MIIDCKFNAYNSTIFHSLFNDEGVYSVNKECDIDNEHSDPELCFDYYGEEIYKYL